MLPMARLSCWSEMCIRDRTYTEGQTLQVYVVDVVSGERGARVMISRTHPGLVKRLFELEAVSYTHLASRCW